MLAKSILATLLPLVHFHYVQAIDFTVAFAQSIDPAGNSNWSFVTPDSAVVNCDTLYDENTHHGNLTRWDSEKKDQTFWAACLAGDYLDLYGDGDGAWKFSFSGDAVSSGYCTDNTGEFQSDCVYGTGSAFVESILICYYYENATVTC